MRTRRALLVGLLPLFAVLLAGCNKEGGNPPPPSPPEVVVVLPVFHEVTDFEEFTGRTEASMSVEIRARLSGYLETLHFKDGADVKKGDRLFTLDQRPLTAEVERLTALLADTQAKLDRLASEYKRIRSLVASRAASQEEAERIAGDRSQADASLAAAKAALKTAKLNLAYSEVRAPIEGRLSKRMVDPGDIVKADETILTTIVKLDPIHAYFDIDERTVLQLRRKILKGDLRSARESTILVKAALADDNGFPLTGRIDFVDNHLDPGTGTLRIRLAFGNPDKLLSPGMFVRMRLPVSIPATAALIPDEAMVSDQGQKYVLIVGAEDKVTKRKVVTGQLHNGLRVVKDCLTASDRVIVQGHQRVRENEKVSPRIREDKSNAAARLLPAPTLPPSL